MRASAVQLTNAAGMASSDLALRTTAPQVGEPGLGQSHAAPQHD